ncbi:DoxX-like family protein [Pseudoalteromonas denitrificans]|uniref:DoxX-like family protein n=1 Tax=Pseudoalteromonas denitrificans DSM 6059 TaxID=1123010 RepID=A0A1I1T2H9_9GAMM|nr:DoxX-like family protein [Pseudoalteromonas denitrificans]SFD51248.1 DoxX-like family protein [Pseudoalteromonas denitrificans DSM 6059]
MSSLQIARFIISFSWLYHGIFPKLVHIAPLEKAMTASIGLSNELSYLVTKSAGVGEVIFGVLFFIFYRNKTIILLNIIGLFGLLCFVAILQPQLLIEAFNPVTTNITLIGFSLILLVELKDELKKEIKNEHRKGKV